MGARQTHGSPSDYDVILVASQARKKIEGYMAMPSDKLDAKIEKAFLLSYVICVYIYI